MIRALLTLLLCTAAHAHELPVRDGLIAWFDASADDTVTTNDTGQLQQWKSKVGPAIATAPRTAPTLVKNALGGKPVVRFSQGNSLHAPKALTGTDQATVFVVFTRPSADKPDSHWQKILTNGTKNKGIFLQTGQADGEIKTTVFRGGFQNDLAPDLWFGTNESHGWGGLRGDIAEVLVYDKTFYVEEPIAAIVTYLEKKWGFQEDRSSDWTRDGPLPKTPAHSDQKLPLSDQNNQGKWQPHHEMWDEFAAPALDHEKWWDHNPNWYGRAPARYLAREIQIKNGEMHLSMRKDPDLPKEDLYKNGRPYHTYSSGSLKSKKATSYGYFEIKARAMSSAASSAWWFSGSSRDLVKKGTHQIEIDVFEIGARSPGHEHSYNMNAHIFRTPGEERHWNKGGSWKAPFRFDEAFHVYGLEWTPEFIRYYVDGALVRSLKNTHWHAPMYMIFDSETMIDWLGAPRDSELPATFRVQYVRAWKNEQTKPQWWKRYQIRKEENSKITTYVRMMAERREEIIEE
ncbi:family 16 glycosylhydrolase [Verrucomicrobiaceae bacterium 227]